MLSHKIIQQLIRQLNLNIFIEFARKVLQKVAQPLTLEKYILQTIYKYPKPSPQTRYLKLLLTRKQIKAIIVMTTVSTFLE